MQRLSELSNFTQLITWRHAWLTKKTHLGKAALTQIIRLCMQLPGHLGSQSTCPCRKLLPVVVFVFSRKRIDQTADNLNSLDLTSASEKAEIHIFVEQSVSRLKGGDRRLPQIIRLKQMLKRGLGVHHAGLSLLQSNPTQFNSIQFNSIQFNSIQFNPIQFNSTQFNSIQFNCSHEDAMDADKMPYSTPCQCVFDFSFLHVCIVVSRPRPGCSVSTLKVLSNLQRSS
jgi:hypothetical protein